ncbi:MAG: hypothetical protein ABW171_03695 [Steroidobacter sp.]
MRARGPVRSRGFALIAALFLLILVAVLGTFAMRLNSSQQTNTDLELGGVGADAALQSGIQYAAARVLAAGCGGLPAALPNLAQSFTVSFSNCQQLPVANAPPVNVFSVTATATRGLYGSPDFVSRQRTVRITP